MMYVLSLSQRHSLMTKLSGTDADHNPAIGHQLQGLSLLGKTNRQP